MSPVLGIIASSNQQGRGGGPVSAYDALATAIVPSGNLAQITFAGVPSGYQHLQIRFNARGTFAASGLSMTIELNGTAASGGYRHHLYGNGSGTPSGYAATFYGTIGGTPGSTVTSNIWGGGIMDILDYSKTTKTKTLRYFNAFDANGSGETVFGGGYTPVTAAITNITFYIDGSWLAGSTMSLYGVK
jgi:hypothetical protein